MQTVLPSEFKRQMVLMLDGSPHVVEDMHTSGTAQTRHRLHTRLRHLTTGRVIERVFAENDRVPVAALETRRATYSYASLPARSHIGGASSTGVPDWSLTKPCGWSAPLEERRCPVSQNPKSLARPFSNH
jgi:hypothetical protein